jgi:hypothetical protein
MKVLMRACALTLLVLPIQACVLLTTPASGSSDAVERWRIEAQNTTIVRDDWGGRAIATRSLA